MAKSKKTERILLESNPELKAAMEKAFRGYLPVLQKAISAYAELGYPETVSLDLINSLVSDRESWFAFDQNYRSWFYDNTPSINQLPMEKEAVLPHLRLPAAYTEFKNAIDQLVYENQQPDYTLPSGYQMTFPMNINLYTLEGSTVAVNEEQLNKHLEKSTETYLEDPVHIELYNRLTALVEEMNTLRELLRGGLFGYKTQLQGIVFQPMDMDSNYGSTEIKLNVAAIRSISTESNPALAKFMGTTWVPQVQPEEHEA
ncbi:hypothetical protein QNI16_14700 [Cytophagaceae bacterium YF14B1]|uniref:Uncharacterized protein n=1 Tax=Xanthocytophaga flava TaxID=3048013 RepID=A0AAE3QLX2_9BACT|nr:hypothetical protein [Xanthocytophaga flavus]MDJ1481747.1 hypothetical protein [Xanthocytophaga flavus]